MNNNENQKQRKKWTEEEGKRLEEAVKLYGHDWNRVSEHVKTRNKKQCRERYKSFHTKEIIKGPFSKEEQDRFHELFQIYGKSWSAIANEMPGRNHNAIKNYFNSIYKNSEHYEEEPEPLNQPTYIDDYNITTGNNEAQPSDMLEALIDVAEEEYEKMNKEAKRKNRKGGRKK